MNSMKGQKDMTLKDEPPRSESVQCPTGEEQRTITNSSWKNEVAEPKWKQNSVVVKVKSDAVKTLYCIGTCNVRSRNQGKLDVVKQR